MNDDDNFVAACYYPERNIRGKKLIFFFFFYKCLIDEVICAEFNMHMKYMVFHSVMG